MCMNIRPTPQFQAVRRFNTHEQIIINFLSRGNGKPPLYFSRVNENDESKESRQRSERFNPVNDGKSRVRQTREQGLAGRHPAKSL